MMSRFRELSCSLIPIRVTYVFYIHRLTTLNNFFATLLSMIDKPTILNKVAVLPLSRVVYTLAAPSSPSILTG